MVYTVYSTNIPPSVSVIGSLCFDKPLASLRDYQNGKLPLTSTSGGTCTLYIHGIDLCINHGLYITYYHMAWNIGGSYIWQIHKFFSQDWQVIWRTDLDQALHTWTCTHHWQNLIGGSLIHPPIHEIKFSANISCHTVYVYSNMKIEIILYCVLAYSSMRIVCGSSTISTTRRCCST